MSSVRFISGGVRVTSTPNLLALFQEIDGISDAGITAACIAQQFPVMANGANMAFRKADFISLQAYEKDKHIASGDDIFLIASHSKQVSSRGHLFKSCGGYSVQTAALNNPFTFLTTYVNVGFPKPCACPILRITAVLVFNYLYVLAIIASSCLAFIDMRFLYMGLKLFTGQVPGRYTIFMCLPTRFSKCALFITSIAFNGSITPVLCVDYRLDSVSLPATIGKAEE
jgi:hypothetical protein